MWIQVIKLTDCIAAFIKDTMVSIHGKYHTALNIDLEMDEEQSKDKGIVRNASRSLYLYKLIFL